MTNSRSEFRRAEDATSSSEFDWRLFIRITALGLLGVAALLPAALDDPDIGGLSIPLAVIVTVQLLANTAIIAVAAAVGVSCGPRTGLGAPVVSRGIRSRSPEHHQHPMAPRAAVSGIIVGIQIIILDVTFFSHVLELSPGEAAELGTLTWRRVMTVLYGALTEEILFRFGLMTGLVWLVMQLRSKPAGRPGAVPVLSVVVVTSLLFGLGHVPATLALGSDMDPLAVVIRALALNAPASAVFSMLYWRYGLESAFIAHGVADIAIILGPPLLAQ